MVDFQDGDHPWIVIYRSFGRRKKLIKLGPSKICLEVSFILPRAISKGVRSEAF